jgi:hypothetical protein
MTKGFAHGGLLREKAMRAQSSDDMFHWIETFFAAADADALEEWAQSARHPSAGGAASVADEA